MMYDELVKNLRYLAKVYSVCENESTNEYRLAIQAADAIEELHQKLCDWCGVCPKERRRPYECEIIYPKMQVPEVSIVLTKDGEA